MAKTRRFDSTLAWEAVCWLDEDGNRIDDVEDRFNHEFLCWDLLNERYFPSEFTIRECGLPSLSLKCADRLGFLTIEYQDVLIAERATGQEIRSEDALDGLYPERTRSGFMMTR